MLKRSPGLAINYAPSSTTELLTGTWATPSPAGRLAYTLRWSNLWLLSARQCPRQPRLSALLEADIPIQYLPVPFDDDSICAHGWALLPLPCGRGIGIPMRVSAALCCPRITVVPISWRWQLEFEEIVCTNLALTIRVKHWIPFAYSCIFSS